jgi:hypothetical protein
MNSHQQNWGFTILNEHFLSFHRNSLLDQGFCYKHIEASRTLES